MSLKIWSPVGGAGGGGGDGDGGAMTLASVTFEHGDWKREVVHDPALTVENTGSSATPPANPTFSFTVEQSDLPVITGSPAGFVWPTALVVGVALRRSAADEGGTYAGSVVTVNVNGVETGRSSVSTSQMGQFITHSSPARDVKVGDVIDVFVWNYHAGAVFEMDWRGVLATVYAIPKTPEAPHLIRRDVFSVLNIPAPVSVLATGPWAFSTSSSWYTKSKGESGNGTSAPRIYDVTGPDNEILSPSSMGVSAPTGNGIANSTQRALYMHHRVAQYDFAYLALPAEM